MDMITNLSTTWRTTCFYFTSFYNWLLKYGTTRWAESNLRVKEASHPEALGTAAAEPLRQLIMARQQARPPAAQGGGLPGALQPAAWDARREEGVKRLVQALAQGNGPCRAQWADSRQGTMASWDETIEM